MAIRTALISVYDKEGRSFARALAAMGVEISPPAAQPVAWRKQGWL